MTTWIALIRGVGGGIRPLPMKPLVAHLTDGGFRSVRTYIASGNVLFSATRGTAASFGERISRCISENFGFDAHVIVLRDKELGLAAKQNPFPKADENPKTLHLFFLARAPASLDLDAIRKLKAPSEDFALKGNVFYLYTPKGFGLSKLATRVEKALGVEATARNWNTVTKLLELAGE